MLTKVRNILFVLIGVIPILSLGWHFLSAPNAKDLQIIGTVDADEVILSSRLPGRITMLTVEEGDEVQVGQLIATIESADLVAARNAAKATSISQQYKLQESSDTERQTRGNTSSQVIKSAAQLRATRYLLMQAQAQYQHQEADTSRTVALAKEGVMSLQARDEALTALDASRAAVESAQENLSSSEAALEAAKANTIQAQAAATRIFEMRGDVQNAQALLDQAQIQVGYTRVVSPISGKVDVRAALQGEVVSAGTPIVTITDLKQTWVYAPLPETESDAVELGDLLRVVMPSGATVHGRLIAKSTEAEFATQRDVNRRKRDIKTIRLKLLIDNKNMRYVPGMIAEVYIPKRRLTTQ